MTLGWFVFIGGIILVILGIAVGICCLKDKEGFFIIGSIIIGLAISILSGFWLYGKESSENIEKTVTVYDISGSVIKTYEGKFDIESNTESQYILFEDDHGKKHTVYYTTGTISVDEK